MNAQKTAKAGDKLYRYTRSGLAEAEVITIGPHGTYLVKDESGTFVASPCYVTTPREAMEQFLKEQQETLPSLERAIVRTQQVLEGCREDIKRVTEAIVELTIVENPNETP